MSHSNKPSTLADATFTKIEQRKKQLLANDKEAKRLWQQLKEISKFNDELQRNLHKQQLKAIVGQQVKPLYRSSSNPELNGTVSTLLKVNRTFCKVDFGEFGRWDMPTGDVTWLEAEQGTMLPIRVVR
ncbi:hypothetical protein [Adhaeretor mobilis]|uniref:Uncharacterized protein n=1 Tax=Adhaeretor mobilis TaxID=1930276 RepID=A0A517MS41_9BACT|nr:hypothetical protein [Adhaeretor mobilis]QDS97703.1 hypothetical protein HG15A2_09670 [Adhaeretor mobilis]